MGSSGDESREVREFLEGPLMEAYESYDLDRWCGSFTQDVVVMVPGEAPIEGQESWRSFMARHFESSTQDHRYEIKDLTIAGDCAIERHIDASTRHGKRSYWQGMFLLRRQADSSWKIARYMLSPYAEVEPSP